MVVKRGSQMSEETGLAAVDSVVHAAQQYRYEGIKLKYTGGEPTLKFPLIQQLHEFARRLTGEAGLELQEVVLSNGSVFNV